MRVLDGAQVLMRIHFGEGDRYQRKPLYQALVELFRNEKLAGTTVPRGIVGFGAKSHLQTTNLLQLSQDLPIVVEVLILRRISIGQCRKLMKWSARD